MNTRASTRPIPRDFASEAAKAKEAITILIVDDDQDCRLLFRDAIRQSKVYNRVFEAPMETRPWISCTGEGDGPTLQGRG